MDALRVCVDGSLKLELHGSRVTRDAGLLTYRELDDALDLTATPGGPPHDSRTGKKTRHTMIALLRQSAHSRLAGYDDTNDAERLSVDPAVRRPRSGHRGRLSSSTTRVLDPEETHL